MNAVEETYENLSGAGVVADTGRNAVAGAVTRKGPSGIHRVFLGNAFMW